MTGRLGEQDEKSLPPKVGGQVGGQVGENEKLLPFDHFIEPNLEKLATKLGCRDLLPSIFCQDVSQFIVDDTGDVSHDDDKNKLKYKKVKDSLFLIPLISLDKGGGEEGKTSKSDRLAKLSKQLLNQLGKNFIKNSWSRSHEMDEDHTISTTIFKDIDSLLHRLTTPVFEAYFLQEYQMIDDCYFEDDYYFGRWRILDTEKGKINDEERMCEPVESRSVHLPNHVQHLDKNSQEPRYYHHDAWSSALDAVSQVSMVKEICKLVLEYANILQFPEDWVIDATF
jgi:hypothetical protein